MAFLFGAPLRIVQVSCATGSCADGTWLGRQTALEHPALSTADAAIKRCTHMLQSSI